MKRKGRRGLILCLLFVLGFTLGCGARAGDYAIDSKQFYASFKPQDDDAYGKKTACYDGRIYYLSDESGTQGVHSMRPDGSDVRLYLGAEDIRSIQITEDAVWLASYFDIIYRQYGGYWRQFQTFRVDRKTGEVTQLAKTLSAEQEKLFTYPYDSVWQAYAFSDGTVAVQHVWIVSWGGFESNSFMFVRDGQLLRFSERPNLLYNGYEQGWDSEVGMWQRGNLLICGEHTHNVYEMDVGMVLDMENGRQPLCMDLFVNAYNYYTSTPRLIKDGIVYYLDGGEIQQIDLKNNTRRTLMQATDDEPIRIALPSADGTKLLLLAQTWIRSPQQLYRADLARGESQLLLRLPRSAAFVHLDETRAIAAKGKKLLFYDLTGEQAEQTGTMELSTCIVDRRNKVECAGGWLFLYRFNDKTMRDELVEKVRIG